MTYSNQGVQLELVDALEVQMKLCRHWQLFCQFKWRSLGARVEYRKYSRARQYSRARSTTGQGVEQGSEYRSAGQYSRAGQYSPVVQGVEQSTAGQGV
jgi:hypothetical protein